MKNYISYLFLIFIANTGLNAQNWTDTQIHPRNVILEEITGIYCPACPAGHLVSHEIDSANPSRIITIGIHSSDSYSKPHTGTNDPDFRTDWGSALYSMSSCGYLPSGMVNRTLFDSAECGSSVGLSKGMTRGSWEASSNEILADDSAGVNIGVRSLWDENTRNLSIDVELYYQKEQNLFNKLHIALLQNNIEGHQSGSSSNPDQVLSNGNYNHMHVLRDMITGLGEKIENITVGEWKTFHFDYTVDSALIDVPVNIENCELAIFVNEFSNSNTITGVAIHAKNDSTNSTIHNTNDKLPISKTLQVYPNPSNGEVIFDLASNTKGEIIVWDFLGSIVFQKSINDRKTKVNTKDFNPGLYLYKLKTKNTSYSGKLMLR